MDGAISFWSLDHNEAPLAIHVLPTHGDLKQAEREPVFKLTWSSFPNLDECKTLLSADTPSSKSGIARLVGPTLDYAGGETVLTILGGLLTTDAPGVRVLQFAPITFDSAANTATTDPETLLGDLSRQLVAIGLERCASIYPVDDFVLLPRSNPHFNSSHDPISILQLCNYGGLPQAPSSITASDFPPPLRPAPSFSSLPFTSCPEIHPFPVQLSPESDDSAHFRLPSAIFSGPNAILGARAIRPDRESFSVLIREWINVGAAEEADGVSNPRRLPLRAGVARGDMELPLPGGSVSINQHPVTSYSRLVCVYPVRHLSTPGSASP
jgi:syntaxin-binding protein 5